MSGGGGTTQREPSAEEKGLWDEQGALAREIAAQSRQQGGYAREMWDNWKSEGLPLLKDVGNQIKNWASPSRIKQQEGMAVADVNSAYDREKSSLTNSLGRYGMNPGSGKFAAGLRSLALGRAASTAGAKTGARTGILERDIGQKMGLVSAWRGDQQGAMRGLSASSSGLGSASGQLGRVSGSMASDRRAGDRMNAEADAGFWGGVGSLAGSLGSAWILASDVRLKRNIELIDQLENGVFVYEFNYIDDPDTMYTGVLAHELIQVMPHLVGEYGGYLTVDYQELIQEVANG